MIRNPVVAGQFYPASPKELKRQIGEFIQKDAKKERAFGVVSPHAGYIFSGSVAGAVYSRVEVPDKVVILGPNHTGRGVPFSIVTEGSWVTPLGSVKIASGLGRNILGGSKCLQEDTAAHAFEHSIEVQLPFLQYMNPRLSFVPVCLSSGDYGCYEDIASAIYGAVKSEPGKVLLVASSDMTHYEPAEFAKRQDNKAIESIIKLDEKLLLKRVKDFNISMCGYVPAAVMLIAGAGMCWRTQKLYHSEKIIQSVTI